MRLLPHPQTLSVLCSALALLTACGTLPPGGASCPTNASAPAPAATPRTLATPQAGGRTAEGGFMDGYFFAERPGDVTFNPVAFTGGMLRATGEIDPRHGSTWGGIAVTTSLARNNRTTDISSAHALVMTLASAGASPLRVRLVGPNAATRDSGCYPVATVLVTPEPREYTLPIGSFAPEAFCGPGAPGGVATAAALAAVEVADAVVLPGRKRPVDFSVGAIRVMP